MINLEQTFSPRVNPADANYPFGSIKDNTSPGANDGTPLAAVWGNNWEGFTQAAMTEAGIIPNGLPDDAKNSQIAEALREILTRPLWTRSTRESGKDLVAGSFEEGATLTLSTQVLWCKKQHKVYAWKGALPKTVPADSEPATAGGIGPAGWQDATGTVLRDDLLDRVLQARSGGRLALSDIVSIGDFDGATNAEKLTAAVAYASSKSPNSPAVFCPPEMGDITVSVTIPISDDIEIFGDGFLTSGTRIIHAPTLNAPMFTVTNSSRFTGLSIIGSNEAGNTNEVMFDITNTNNVMFSRVSFFYSQTAVKFGGAAPCFYATFHQCRFENTRGAFITVDNTSDGGVDLILTETRMLGAITGRALWFKEGLGSIICSDLQVSVIGDGPIGQLVLFGTPAPLWGGGQFVNCVFESGGTSENAAALYLLGTSARPWTELQFNGTLLTGTANAPAAVIGYARGLRFVGTTFSSSDAAGGVQFLGAVEATGVKMIACKHETLGAGPCIAALANTTIGLEIVASNFTGNNTFIDFSLVQKELVSLSVHGGEVGTAVSPILLQDYKNSKCDISTRGFGFGPTKEMVLVGTLDGAGTASIAHGITSGQARILSVSAYYRGGSGEARPLTVGSFDGNNIAVSSGTASAKYRILVLYSDKVDANW